MKLLFRLSYYDSKKPQYTELIALDLQRLFSWVNAHIDYKHLTISINREWKCSHCKVIRVTNQLTGDYQCKACGHITCKN